MTIQSYWTSCKWYTTSTSTSNTWHIDVQRKFGCSNNHSTVSTPRHRRCILKIFTISLCCIVVVAVNIPYNFVTSVLNHFGLNQCDNAPSLKPSQITSILHDIYFAAEKCGHFSQSVDFNLERCTVMLANLLWSIFDPWVFVCWRAKRDAIVI